MDRTYNILEDSSNPHAYQPYGAAAAFWRFVGAEGMLSGPAETGKTLLCLHKVDAFCWKYPGARALLVRKTLKSIYESVLPTYLRKVLLSGSPVKAYGGQRQQHFDYPNGSRLVLGGMDRPGKVLSSEYDLVYANQAEALSLEDWEMLATRVTGRAGNAPYAQLLGDCNPGPSTHWVLARKDEGKLALFNSKHEDNPMLFNPASGAITRQGQRTMAVLDKLSGTRHQRLRLGQWASAEGIVYEDYDPATHLVDPFPVPADWRRIRSIDFGYTNPFVCQWWAMDGEGRLWLYREIYLSGRIVEDHARQIIALSRGEHIEATVADHDAEDRATLHRYDIPTVAAHKGIRSGIQAVQQRMRPGRDGKPRLFIMRGAGVEEDGDLRARRKPTCTAQEMVAYRWPEIGQGTVVKELPVKNDDHGMDALRYAVMYVDGGLPQAPSLVSFIRL